MASDVIKDQERGGEDLLEYSALRNQGFSHLPQCALLIFHIAADIFLNILFASKKLRYPVTVFRSMVFSFQVSVYLTT